MVQNIIVTTDQQLKALLDDVINKAFEKKLSTTQPPTKTKPLNVSEVCELTGYSESSIRTKVMHREIPFHKRGARVFFFTDEILSWIKEGRQKTKSEIEAEA